MTTQTEGHMKTATSIMGETQLTIFVAIIPESSCSLHHFKFTRI